MILMCKHANSAGQSLEMSWREDFGTLGEGKSRNPLLLTENNGSSLELVVTEHKSWCICPAQGYRTTQFTSTLAETC